MYRYEVCVRYCDFFIIVIAAMALAGLEFSGSWLDDSSPLVKPFSCANANVSYANRVDDPTHFNFCTVPDSAYDAVLFAAVALLVAASASVRMSALNVLLVGGSSCPNQLHHVRGSMALKV